MHVIAMSVDTLASHVGPEKAGEIFNRYFVIPIFVAEQLCLNETIREIVGLEKTLELCRRFGGRYIQLHG